MNFIQPKITNKFEIMNFWKNIFQEIFNSIDNNFKTSSDLENLSNENHMKFFDEQLFLNISTAFSSISVEDTIKKIA